eukprot:763885-Hanusia_phi.AAC.3
MLSVSAPSPATRHDVPFWLPQQQQDRFPALDSCYENTAHLHALRPVRSLGTWSCARVRGGKASNESLHPPDPGIVGFAVKHRSGLLGQAITTGQNQDSLWVCWRERHLDRGELPETAMTRRTERSCIIPISLLGHQPSSLALLLSNDCSSVFHRAAARAFLTSRVQHWPIASISLSIE